MQDNQSPESALQTFVEARIGHVVTRSFVLERVTGKMKQSMENVTDEEFTSFADMRSVKQNSFKVLSKSCQQKKCFITYSVSYLTKEEEKTTFTSEVKKIAEIVNEEGKWLIADVSNIKTYHEALQPINPLE
jgi:hypothetical protein